MEFFQARLLRVVPHTRSTVSQAACENVPNQKKYYYYFFFNREVPMCDPRHRNRRDLDACILQTNPLIERVALLLLIF